MLIPNNRVRISQNTNFIQITISLQRELSTQKCITHKIRITNKKHSEIVKTKFWPTSQNNTHIIFIN